MLPIILKKRVMLPYMITHVDIQEKETIQKIKEVASQNGYVFCVTEVDFRNVDEHFTDYITLQESGEEIGRKGCVASIKKIVEVQENNIRVLLEGVMKGEICQISYDQEPVSVQVDALSWTDPIVEAEVKNIRVGMSHYIGEIRKENDTLGIQLEHILDEQKDVKIALDMMVAKIPMPYPLQYLYLQQKTFREAFEYFSDVVVRQVQMLHYKQEIDSKVRDNVEQNQKEYLLREQLKVISDELGEGGPGSDAKKYEERLQKLDCSDTVRQKLTKEIQRFKGLPFGNQEASVLQNYIETILEMPWNHSAEECLDLKKAEKILEKEHYGLEKVKERVLEYLAVEKLNGKSSANILCLVGPPGTGKSSIARSIAHALNKPFVRVSLGGVRDEAEIRGHRKTYVGAMPGRVANAIKEAKVNNPVILLDEVDKLSSDYKGDPSSALLEVMDPGQNKEFRDHFLELPLDLSKVMFVATANELSNIPSPLVDRMEVISVSSYTENEKFHIATQYLLPRQKEENGLTNRQLFIEDDAIRHIIRFYTREAGVRSLERRLAALCRKAAKQILDGKKRIMIREKDLEGYLGKENFRYDVVSKKAEVGVVRGLAWTMAGGDTLQIEVTVMPGTGKMQLTGQMGDVMKESAQIALSYVRSISTEYQIPADFFETHDLHIHIPEGSVPKDGPSAGITMTTAILSAVTKKCVKPEIAMTGEVTLRGKVLPIGGLKEKVLAAKMAGVTKVLVPDTNRVDIEELSEEITGGLEFSYVENMNQVIAQAFV